MTKKLSEMAVGKAGKIIAVGGTGAIRRRLLDMGITKGASVEIVKFAPFGDPIEIKLRGYSLTLRKSEAAMAEVEV